MRCEDYRICSMCGDKIYEGFEHGNEGTAWCEGCFDFLIHTEQIRLTPGLRDGQTNEADGYYDELIEDEYEPSNIYWTQWC